MVSWGIPTSIPIPIKFIARLFGNLCEIKDTEAKCNQAGGLIPACFCSRYDEDERKAAEMYGAQPDVIYWLKYPRTGSLQIFPNKWVRRTLSKKTCSFCSGCINLSKFYSAVATIQQNIEKFVSIVTSRAAAFYEAFKAKVLAKINAQITSANTNLATGEKLPLLAGNLISGVYTRPMWLTVQLYV